MRYSLAPNMEYDLDCIVLDFQDSLLRKSDVQLLEDGQWLNDKIIGFMFEYFEYEQFKDLHDVLFINPDVVQCIKLSTGNELSIFLEPLQVETKNVILLPVNSHENPNSIGGSHWSLLVYDRSSHSFQHYDSAATFNNSQAKKICETIKPFLKAKQKLDFMEAQCPQQTNSYDCGMYVISFAEYLCERRQQKSALKNVNDITPMLVKKKRREIKEIIECLKLSKK